MDTIPQKICTKCHTLRPLSDFHKRSGTKDGHAYMCRVCQSAYDRAPEVARRKLDRLKERYHSDPEYRERAKARHRDRYQSDPEYRKASIQSARRWQQENRDRTNEGQRMRYAAYYGPIDRVRRNTQYHRKRKAAQARRRYLAPEVKERLAAVQLQRKRWIAASIEHFTEQEWDQLCEQYEYCCAACGQFRRLTVDHIVPLSRGGSDGIDNIQPLCHRCNTSKGAKTIDYR